MTDFIERLLERIRASGLQPLYRRDPPCGPTCAEAAALQDISIEAIGRIELHAAYGVIPWLAKSPPVNTTSLIDEIDSHPTRFSNN